MKAPPPKIRYEVWKNTCAHTFGAPTIRLSMKVATYLLKTRAERWAGWFALKQPQEPGVAVRFVVRTIKPKRKP